MFEDMIRKNQTEVDFGIMAGNRSKKQDQPDGCGDVG